MPWVPARQALYLPLADMVYGLAIVADPSGYPLDRFALVGVWGRRGDALRPVTLVRATYGRGLVQARFEGKVLEKLSEGYERLPWEQADSPAFQPLGEALRQLGPAKGDPSEQYKAAKASNLLANIEAALEQIAVAGGFVNLGVDGSGNDPVVTVTADPEGRARIIAVTRWISNRLDPANTEFLLLKRFV